MMPLIKSETKLKANKLSFDAIGTHWQIDYTAPQSDFNKIDNIIFKTIEDFDKTYSRFRPDSWVMQIGKNPGSYKVPENFDKLYRFYESMAEITDEKVTLLIGEVMERAGYDDKYSLVPSKLIRPKPLSKALNFNNNTLHVKYKCTLDFGAAGKGYLVDIISNKLDSLTYSYLIDAGGDIKNSPAKSSLSTPVGLEDPSDPTKIIGIVKLNSSSLCGSAGNRRNWGKYHHIINPKKLESVTDITATWVIADETMLADGMATCLFFEKPEKLLKEYNFEYLILKCDNTISISKNFNAEIFYG